MTDTPSNARPSGTPLRVVIVDDEPLARRRLRALLAAHADVAVVAEAEDVPGAIRAARTIDADLMLLDVRLPGGDGFDVARRVLERGAEGLHAVPFIVFVTADPTAAIPAFDVDAVDFLLKPYDADRLARALDRARTARSRRHAQRAPTAEAAPTAAMPTRRWRERFVVIEGRRRRLVPERAVTRIEADDNYVVLHTEHGRHLVRHTLRALEQELDPTQWVRVHRSVMVRRDAIVERRTLDDGEWELRLQDGARVRVGATYRGKLGLRF